MEAFQVITTYWIESFQRYDSEVVICYGHREVAQELSLIKRRSQIEKRKIMEVAVRQIGGADTRIIDVSKYSFARVLYLPEGTTSLTLYDGVDLSDLEDDRKRWRKLVADSLSETREEKKIAVGFLLFDLDKYEIIEQYSSAEVKKQ